jgi:8-oxo-dGTP diphosphatase
VTEVGFHGISFEPEEGLTYSVIVARCSGLWLFVRHRERTTWEIAGGHIEKDESAEQAACRELYEETGALEFDLECVDTYSVRKGGYTGYGRLFVAEIHSLGEIPDKAEIAEIMFSDNLPENLTYEDIQPQLFEKALEFYNANCP